MLRGRRSQVRPTGLDPVPSYCASCNGLDIICGIVKAKEFIMTEHVWVILPPLQCPGEATNLQTESSLGFITSEARPEKPPLPCPDPLE